MARMCWNEKEVMVEPPTTRTTEVPAEYETVTVQRLVEFPAGETLNGIVALRDRADPGAGGAVPADDAGLPAQTPGSFNLSAIEAKLKDGLGD